MPFAQSLDQIIVSWNGFLRRFGLANANDVLHDRARYMNLFGLEVHVSPFQREQLAPPQAGGYSQQDQGLFSKAQICEQSLDFIAGQDIWRRAAFGALPNPLNGIAIAEVVTATVYEQQAHYTPYFAERSWRSRSEERRVGKECSDQRVPEQSR